jgi:excisionase family DNA binding protein
MTDYETTQANATKTSGLDEDRRPRDMPPPPPWLYMTSYDYDLIKSLADAQVGFLSNICRCECSPICYEVAPSEPPSPPHSRLLLTMEEAAGVLGIGRSKMYELHNRGEIEGVKIDRSTRIPVEALSDFIRALQARQYEGDGSLS